MGNACLNLSVNSTAKSLNIDVTRQFVKRVATCQMRNDMELQLVATKGCSESFYIS